MGKSNSGSANGSVKWQDRVGRRIKLRDLHIVLATAQTGSMAKAASSLAMSHPVVSKTISELEHVLGKRLFDRSVRGVVPTAYGEALVKCALAVFDEMRRGIQEIDFLGDHTVGKLRFACPEAIAAGLMQAAASRFMDKYPKVVLDILQAETVTARYAELRAREVEFVIGRIPATMDENDLIAEKLFDERLLVVAGANCPWVRRRRVSLGDLIDEPWVLPPGESVPGALGYELFRAAGHPMPRAGMLTLSIHLQNALLANGRFLTLLPSSLLHFSGKRYGLAKVPARLPPQASYVGIVMVKDRTPSPLAQKFVECVRDVAAPLTERNSPRTDT